MSISLESENGVIVGAFPNVYGSIPHVGLVTSDPQESPQRIIFAKLSPADARAIASALGAAATRVEPAWEEWFAITNDGPADPAPVHVHYDHGYDE